MEYAASRKQAIFAGDVKYFTGKPCPSGHIVPRYTSNAACTECLDITQLDRQANSVQKERRCRNNHIYKGSCCLECRAQWILDHPLTEKQKQAKRELQAKRIDRCRIFVRDLKATTPCTDCESFYEWFQMEFDHIESRKGGPTVAALVATGSLERILREIEKCELVCCNCHATRTHHRAVKSGQRRGS